MPEPPNGPPPSESAAPPPPDPDADGEIEEGEDMEEDEMQMMAAMGFGGFDSTKVGPIAWPQQLQLTSFFRAKPSLEISKALLTLKSRGRGVNT
jgi:hypothetical protein